MTRAYYLAAFALMALALTLPTGTAPGNLESCSDVTATSGTGGTRQFKVGVSGAALAGDGCASDNLGIVEALSGSSIGTLRCREVTAGIGPPISPDTVTIRGYADNNAFNSPGTAGIWSRTVTGSCGADTVLTEVFCTADGTSGGAASYGTVRLMIRGQQDDVGQNYDVNSDTGNWGAYRCNPRIDLFTDTASGTVVSVYVPTDTFRTTVSGDSAVYNSGANAGIDALCNGVVKDSSTTFTLATGNELFGAALKGTLTKWPDDCTLSHTLTINKKSTISGWTGEDYYEWDTTSPESGVTFAGNVATHTINKVSDRTLTPSDCNTPADAYNRGQGVPFTCTLRDARDAFVLENRLATAFLRRETQAAYDTTDSLGADFLVGASGVASATNTLKTTATDTNSTVPPDYANDVKIYSASRTDTELLNILSVNDRTDATSVYDAQTIVCAKTDTNDRAQNATAFVIGADQEFCSVFRLQDAQGQPVSGAGVTCTREDPNGMTDASVGHGTTDASGHSETAEYTVEAPTGVWSLTCETTHNGNSLGYTVAFSYVSPFTGDTQILVIPQIWWNDDGELTLNVSAHAVRNSAGLFEHLRPDDDGVRMRVHAYSRDTFLPTHFFDPQGELLAPVEPSNARHFWANVTLENVPGDWRFINVEVAMNLSQRTIVGNEKVSEIVLLNETGLGSLTDLTITTAADPWIPYIVLGGAFIFFALARMAFPVAAALLSLAAQFFDPPIFGLPGAAMLIAIAVVLEMLMRRAGD